MNKLNQNISTPISQQHDTGRKALDFIVMQLRPYTVTKPEQGDDYYIDGFVQQILTNGLLHTPVIFAIQSKGTVKQFQNIWSEPLKIIHLLKWEASSLEVLVCVHSLSSNLTRWRFVRDIIAELDNKRTDWRKRIKGEISVQFKKSDERTNNELHEWLELKLNDLLDINGGKHQLHQTIRRVLLTELYHDYAYVGQRGGIAEKPDGPPVGQFISGLQWQKGELDERKVIAHRALCGALLLFEQVYFLSHLTYAVVGALGGRKFMDLIKSERLIPVDLKDMNLVFLTGSESRGDLYFFNSDSLEIQQRELNSLKKKYHLPDSFVKNTVKATKRITLPPKIEFELLDVSKSDIVRNLLGLGKSHPQSKEPIWNAERMLRIGNVVNYYMIANELLVDVVELEPGLSRLALTRWGSRINFHRVYQALNELENILKASALPDLGLLSNRIGIKQCIEISDSQDGQKFRSWFWENASYLLKEKGTLEGELASRISELSGSNPPLPKEFMIGFSETLNGKFEGWASNIGADESLTRQRKFNAARLTKTLTNLGINTKEYNQPCPCGNNSIFINCCGEILLNS